MNRFVGERAFSPNDEGGRDANNFVFVSRGDIRNILESDDFNERNFGLVKYFGASNFAASSSYKSRQNKEMPMYLLSKDGFMMVVMGGFTGAKTRARTLAGYLSPSLFFRQKPCAHEHLFAQMPKT